MTIRRLPDFRMPLLDRWLCRRLPPHDTRVLVKEYVEGPAEGFYDYLPVGETGTIIMFLGTEHYKLYWTCRWWTLHREIFRWIGLQAAAEEATAALETYRAVVEHLEALQAAQLEIRQLHNRVFRGGAAGL